jgi:hypothetical protein
MKFRLRQGFTLYRNGDEMDLHRAGGELARGIRPRAVGGDLVDLNGLERCELGTRLGMFEPVCEAAKREYVGVTPIYADALGESMSVEAFEKARALGGRLTVKRTGEQL